MKKITATDREKRTTQLGATKSKARIKCAMCGKEYTKQQSYFPYSSSALYAHNNNYTNICFNCMCDIYEQYFKLFKDERVAIEKLCLHLDIYYTEKILDTDNYKAKLTVYDKLKEYVRQVNSAYYIEKTYDTTLDERNEYEFSVDENRNKLFYQDKKKLVEMTANLQTENLKLKEYVATLESKVQIDSGNSENLILWGGEFSDQECIILNTEYKDWMSRYIIEDKSRETLVRKMCILNLLGIKALRDNDTKNYSELNKSYMATMSAANLMPRQLDDEQTQMEIPMGKYIKLYEDEEPIPEALPAFKDIDGIQRIILIYFIGHMCKMVGIKNRYAQMYEDEMNKYRPQISDNPDIDSEDIYEHLLNQGFNSAENQDTGDTDNG